MVSKPVVVGLVGGVAILTALGLNFWVLPDDGSEPAPKSVESAVPTKPKVPTPGKAAAEPKTKPAPAASASTDAAGGSSPVPKADLARRPPSFDIVRVDPEGNTVIAGRGKPNAEITILSGDKELGRVTSDERGEWVFLPDEQLGAGEFVLTLRQSGDQEQAESEEAVVLVVPEKGKDIAGRATDTPSQPLAMVLPRNEAKSKSMPAQARVLQAPSAGPAIADTAKPAASAAPATSATEGTASAPGQPAPGQPAPGQPAQGQLAQGQTAQGQTAPGQAAPGQAAQGQAAQGQVVAAAPQPRATGAGTAPSSATASRSASAGASGGSSTLPTAVAPASGMAAAPSAADQTKPAMPQVSASTSASTSASAPAATTAPSAAVSPGVAPATPAPSPAPPRITSAEPAAAAPQSAAAAVSTAAPGKPVIQAFPQPSAAPSASGQGVGGVAGSGATSADVSVDVIEYDEKGEVVFGGTTEPNADVEVFIDEKPAGQTTADADGRWQVRPTEPVAPGNYNLRVDKVEPGGVVQARVAFPFVRAAPLKGLPNDRLVVIQPGNNLWLIATRVYGEGTRYVQIHDANRDQIQNPDMIFPGQVFGLPTVN